MKKEETKTLVRVVKSTQGNSLVVQWLGLHASTAGAQVLISVWETKISQAALCVAKMKNNKSMDK